MTQGLTDRTGHTIALVVMALITLAAIIWGILYPVINSQENALLAAERDRWKARAEAQKSIIEPMLRDMETRADRLVSEGKYLSSMSALTTIAEGRRALGDDSQDAYEHWLELVDILIEDARKQSQENP